MKKNIHSFWDIPRIKFIAVLILGLFFTWYLTHVALLQPKLNTSFTAGDRIESSKGQITLESIDLLNEPGEITDHKEMQRFYDRQQMLATIFSESPVKKNDNILLQTKRSIGDIPFLFWVQVFVGLGALIISGGIWALSSKNIGSRLFAFSGLSMFMSAIPSALYTTRELFLPLPLFQILEELNALGASLFGMSMFALFLVYPIKLRNWKKVFIFECLFFGGWTLMFLLKLTPPEASISLVMVLEMLAICVAIGVQFFATKGNPKARAILTWLGFSVLLGAGAFIGFNTVPLVLEMKPLDQGYSFSFFLIIYIGIAAALRQYRLFEVGQWVFKFLFYAVGAVVLLLLDAALIYFLNISRLPALGLALLVTSFLYLPLRDYISRYLSKHGKVKEHEMLAETLHVAFAPSQGERINRWDLLLRKIFDPLEIIQIEDSFDEVILSKDGLSLMIPSVAEASALKLNYPWQGRSLYSNESKELANQMILLIKQAESSRDAYDRGVAEERRRMAQDLHDDVGARLLTGLYIADEKLRPTIEGALSDIRSIVSGMSGEKISLSNFLADLRFETAQRLIGPQIELDWKMWEEDKENYLDYHHYKTIGSAVREIVSNVIKHAQAKKLKVDIEFDNRDLRLSFMDDGKGLSPSVMNGNNQGNGLRNLHRRLHDINGKMDITKLEIGTQITLIIPSGKIF